MSPTKLMRKKRTTPPVLGTDPFARTARRVWATATVTSAAASTIKVACLLDPDIDLLGFAGGFQGAPDDDTEKETAMKAPPTYNETATTEHGGTKAATFCTDDEDKKVKAKETSPAGNEYDIFGSLQGLNLDDATFDFNPDASFSPISDLDPNDVLLRPVEVNPSAPFRGKSADTLGVLRKSTADQNYGEVEEEDVDEDEVQSEDESSGAVQSEDEDESSEIEEGDTVEIWDGSIYDGHVGRVDQIKNAGYHYVNIGGVIHCVRGKSNLKKTSD